MNFLCLDGILPPGEVGVFLLLLERLLASLVRGQSSTDSTGLFWAEVERHVFFALVKNAQLLSLLGIYHSQGPSNRLADIVDLGELGRSTAGDLLDAEGEQFVLELL